jgi:hypothetical protein
MKRPVSRWFLLFAAGVAACALTGCATMRPISSPPPVPKIVLSAPFSAVAFHGGIPVPFRILLPAGEYRPLYEDDESYYYQAPSKIVVNDPSSFLYDGGVCVLRGSTTPRGWYYIDENGGQTVGMFQTPLPTR